MGLLLVIAANDIRLMLVHLPKW